MILSYPFENSYPVMFYLSSLLRNGSLMSTSLYKSKLKKSSIRVYILKD